MPKHAKLQQKNLIFSSLWRIKIIFCVVAMVIVILEMYHIWYYGHFEKNVFGKNFRESLNPKGFVKNTPYLSIFTIKGKDTMFRLGLSWKLHNLLCLWKLEIYIKTRKKGKILLANSYFDKTDSSHSSRF